MLLKKSKSLALFVRSKYISKKKDGSFFYYKSNDCILLKRKLVLRSKEVSEGVDYNIRRKKLFFKFSGVL